ncbi:MAG: hypothetical protein QW728_07730 [Thermoplasmata archaeon]
MENNNNEAAEMIKTAENPLNALADALKTLNDSLTKVNNIMQNTTATIGSIDLKSTMMINDIITKSAVTENYLVEASKILSSSIVVPPPPPSKSSPPPATIAGAAGKESQQPVWSDKEMIEAAMAKARKEHEERDKHETALASSISAINVLRTLKEEYSAPIVASNLSPEEETTNVSVVSKATEDDRAGIISNTSAKALDFEESVSHQKVPDNRHGTEKESMRAVPSAGSKNKSNYSAALAGLAVGLSFVRPALPVSFSVGNDKYTPIPVNTSQPQEVVPTLKRQESEILPPSPSISVSTSSVVNDEEFTNKSLLSKKDIFSRKEQVESIKPQTSVATINDDNPSYATTKTGYTEPESEVQKKKTNAVGMLAAMAIVPATVSSPLKEGMLALNPLLPSPSTPPLKEGVNISIQKKTEVPDNFEKGTTSVQTSTSSAYAVEEENIITAKPIKDKSPDLTLNKITTSTTPAQQQIPSAAPPSTVKASASPPAVPSSSSSPFANAKTSITALTGFGLMGALAGVSLFSGRTTVQAANIVSNTPTVPPQPSFTQPASPAASQTFSPVSFGSISKTSVSETSSTTLVTGTSKPPLTSQPPEYISTPQISHQYDTGEHGTKPLLTKIEQENVSSDTGSFKPPASSETSSAASVNFRGTLNALSTGMMMSLFIPPIKPSTVFSPLTTPAQLYSPPSNTPAISTPTFRELGPEYPSASSSTPSPVSYGYHNMIANTIYPAIASLYQVPYFTDAFSSPNLHGTPQYPQKPPTDTPLTPSGLAIASDKPSALEESAIQAIQSLYTDKAADNRPVTSPSIRPSSQSFGQNFYSVVRIINESINPLLYKSTQFTAADPLVLNYGQTGTEKVSERNESAAALNGTSLTPPYPVESTQPYFRAIRKLEDISDYGQSGTTTYPRESLSAFNFREGYFGSLASLLGISLSSNIADAGNTVKLTGPVPGTPSSVSSLTRPVIKRDADEEPLVNMKDPTLPVSEFPKYMDYSTPVSRISTYKQIYNKTISKVVQPVMNMQQMISNPNILNQTNILSSNEVSHFTRYIKNDFYPQILNSIVLNQPFNLEARVPFKGVDVDNDISLTKGDGMQSLIRSTSSEMTEASIGAMTVVGRLITRALGMKDIDYTTPKMAKQAVTEDGISTPAMSKIPVLPEGIGTLKMAKQAVTEDGISTPAMAKSPQLLDGIETLKMAKQAVTEDGVSTPVMLK